MAISTSPQEPISAVPITIELQAEIDYCTGNFSYRYGIRELVVAKDQKLLITLKKDRVPPGSIVHIRGYSSTHSLLLPIDEPKLGGTPFPPDEPFPETTDSMLLTLISDYRQMVNFGPHVHCEFTDASGNRNSYTKLYDPQVGNGPP